MQDSSTPDVLCRTAKQSCRDDGGGGEGAWHPTWGLVVLGLDFLAWLLPVALSLSAFPSALWVKAPEAIIAEARLNPDTESGNGKKASELAHLVESHKIMPM